MFSPALRCLVVIVSLVMAVIVSRATSIRSAQTIQASQCQGAELAIPHPGSLGWAYMDPNDDVLDADKTAHRGLDLWPRSNTETDVYAAASGTIITSQPTRMKISHDSGTVDTYYGHVTPDPTLQQQFDDWQQKKVPNPPHVTIGQKIGTLIGHLHFTVMKKNTSNELIFEHSVDPSPYLNAKLNYYDNGQYPAWSPQIPDVGPPGQRASYNRTILDWCNAAPMGQISGVVYLPSGQEVSNALVTIEGIQQTRKTNFWMGPTEKYPNAVTWNTQAKGGYAFSNVPFGDYTVTATARTDSGNLKGHIRIRVESTQPLAVAGIVLQPDTTASISGFVKDHITGKAVPGATVTFRNIFVIPPATTDANGYYRFENVPFGSTKLFARSDTFGEGAVDIDVPQNGTVSVNDIRLLPLCLSPGLVAGRASQANFVPGSEMLAACNTGNQPEGNDFALIIDSSGSMLDADPTNLRKAAAKLFVQALAPTDMVTVVGFDSFPYLVAPLQIVLDSRDAISRQIDQRIGSNGGTDISGGIRLAYDQLNNASKRRKIAILLTDGQQTSGAYDAQWHSAFKAKGWPIYTFGLSSQADAELLQNIADVTSGSFTPLTDPAQLARLYNNLRIAVSRQNQLLDQSLNMQQDETHTALAVVPPFTQIATFVTTWPGSTVDTYIQAPDGTIITPQTSEPFTTHVKDQTFEVYRVSYPVAGVWKMIAYGAQLDPGGEIVTLQADASFALRRVYLPTTTHDMSGAPAAPLPATPTPISPPTPGLSAPSGYLRFVDSGPVMAGSSRPLEITLVAGEGTRWNASAFTSDCNMTGLPSGFATESLNTYSQTTIAYIPPDAPDMCTIQGTVTTYGSVYPQRSLALVLSFQIEHPLSAEPTPTLTNTPVMNVPLLQNLLIRNETWQDQATFLPSETIRLGMNGTVEGGAVPVSLWWQVVDAHGNIIPELSFDNFEATIGPGFWGYDLTRTIPSTLQPGQYTYRGEMRYNGQVQELQSYFSVTSLPGGGLLINGDFEQDSDNDGKPDGWSINQRFTRSSALVHGGSYAGQHFATNDANYRVWQWMPGITAGTAYNLIGYVNIPSTSDAFQFQIEVSWWSDGGSNLISTIPIKTYTTHTNGVWDLLSTDIVAPPGTQSATVRMVITSLQGTINVDDFSFQPR